MQTIRKANERFHTHIEWLDSWHSFSFGEHYDPAYRGFSSLRVINDDRISGGGGFPTHGHKDMEIITVVLSGALAHQDSLGNGSTILPGDVQKMSAGRGILHSEYNASATEPVHLLQLWIVPQVKGVEPAYWQKRFAPEDRRGRFCLVVSSEASEGSLPIHQDACLYVADLETGLRLEHVLKPTRWYWLQVATGSVEVNGTFLAAGDGLALQEEETLTCQAHAPSTVLLFDLVDPRG